MTAGLARILADLGDTPDAVADRLRALGITGRQRANCACPVARYLISRGYDGVAVGGLGDVRAARNGLVEYATLTAAVARFVEWFDGGLYLDLVEVGE